MKKADTQRFEATIRKQGPNSYVDVPEQVSTAFAHLAEADRISVEGKLSDAEGHVPSSGVRGASSC